MWGWSVIICGDFKWFVKLFYLVKCWDIIVVILIGILVFVLVFIDWFGFCLLLLYVVISVVRFIIVNKWVKVFIVRFF